MATNAAEALWASPAVVFFTDGPPQVGNDGGAVVGIGTATLRGEQLGPDAQVSIYWGPTDGGTTAGAWAHVATNLPVENGLFATDVSDAWYGIPWYYRCYTTNAYGEELGRCDDEFRDAEAAQRGHGGRHELHHREQLHVCRGRQ